MSIILEIQEQIAKGRVKPVEELVRKALDEGLSFDEIINNGFIVAMGDVGEKFKNGEIYVPEMLVAARAMKAGLAVLEPLMLASGSGYERKFAGKVLIGTVQGDLHDIGKNLVVVMWQGAGFEVIDLGIDVKPAVFIEAIEKHEPQVVGLAALLTTTMPAMAETIKAIAGAGLREKVKIMVGGAPVTQDYANKIGADAYAADAGAAVSLVKQIVA
jgi:5-methyltetrahydrofolate--homocysteine methyltransferase